MEGLFVVLVSQKVSSVNTYTFWQLVTASCCVPFLQLVMPGLFSV